MKVPASPVRLRLLSAALASCLIVAPAWAKNGEDGRGGGPKVSVPGGKLGGPRATARETIKGGIKGGDTVSPTADAGTSGEVLVKLATTQALPALLSKYPLTLLSRFGARPIYRLKVIGNVRAQDLLPQLALEPGVLIAEDNPLQRSPEARKNVAWAIGTQQDYVAQWGPQAMRLAEAQRLGAGAGVRVAVLDTGVDLGHPALAGRLLPGFDFVDFDADPSEGGTAGQPSHGHGTHVAGLVALAAPAAKIMPIRVLDADGVGNAWVLAEALLHAIDPDGNPATDDGAHVINLSLGSLSRTGVLGAVLQIAACTPALAGDAVGDRSDPGYADDEARCTGRVGAVVVAAAGNDASSEIRQYPAAEGEYGLVPVAASNAAGRVAGFSNSGGWIELAAPGEGLTSAVPGGYATWSGTSMAAPLVSGTAALVRARFPTMSGKDLARRLEDSAAAMCGTKLRQLDAVAAVTGARASAVCR